MTPSCFHVIMHSFMHAINTSFFFLSFRCRCIPFSPNAGLLAVSNNTMIGVLGAPVQAHPCRPVMVPGKPLPLFAGFEKHIYMENSRNCNGDEQILFEWCNSFCLNCWLSCGLLCFFPNLCCRVLQVFIYAYYYVVYIYREQQKIYTTQLTWCQRPADLSFCWFLPKFLVKCGKKTCMGPDPLSFGSQCLGSPNETNSGRTHG